MKRLRYATFVLLGVLVLTTFTFCNSGPTNTNNLNNDSTANGQVPSFSDISLITTEDGLKASQVYALTVCPNSEVWYGYGPNGQGVTKIIGGTATSFDNSDGLSANGVYALYCDSENRVWIGYGANGGGLTVLADEDWKTFTTEDGLHSNNVLSITVNNNEVWLSYGAQFSGVSNLK